MESVTAPRSRSWSAPSAKTQMGCQVKTGASGWSAVTDPSCRARQRRASRENCEGVRVMWRFSLWPRTSQAGTSPWSNTGATVPCSARSFSYRPIGSFSASGPYSRRSPLGVRVSGVKVRPWAGQPGGGAPWSSVPGRSAKGVVTVTPGIGPEGPEGRGDARRRDARGGGYTRGGCGDDRGSGVGTEVRAPVSRAGGPASAGSASASAARPGSTPGAARRSRPSAPPRAGRARYAAPRRGGAARPGTC